MLDSWHESIGTLFLEVRFVYYPFKIEKEQLLSNI